jgi:AcrR family transcriptional regulator
LPAVETLAADRTRIRILEGAARAVARHGLAKLDMGDVSQQAAVSRGTLYRYFPNRDELLATLALHEGRRFQEEVAAAVRAAPPGADRLEVALRYATQHAREHPVLSRILETDPAFVLRAIRDRLSELRALIHGLLAPLLEETTPVVRGIATVEQLVDWLTRVMISAYLFPDPAPAEMARGLTAVYRMLTAPTAARRATRARSRRASTRTRR